MTKRTDFVSLTLLSVSKEALKKIVFSRPVSDGALKVTGRLCAHRGQRLLALEYSLPSGTVSQKNLREGEIEENLLSLLSEYGQANLLTALGDAEWKISKKGAEVLLGADKLLRKLNGEAPSFEKKIEELDKKKNYILHGSEDFLTKLGISDKNGRVHDKKQGKFRQINRFLEHIEDIYSVLPSEGKLTVYDLCCGKSYLSFAVYYYLTEVKKRTVSMLGIDLKRDVIEWCDALARELKYDGMRFVCDDITNTPKDVSPDMVISLHACDIATDIVLNRAIELSARVILSTPCCHKYLNDKINNEALRFVTEYPHLRNKLCEAITDAIRIARLTSHGYSVSAMELTDPENTPKNTLIRAIFKGDTKKAKVEAVKYDDILTYILGNDAKNYLKEISK